jgi:signal transduction histidine kinase
VSLSRPFSVRLHLAVGFLLVALASVLVTALLARGAANAQMSRAIRAGIGRADQSVAVPAPPSRAPVVDAATLITSSSRTAVGGPAPAALAYEPLVQGLNDRLERESVDAALLAAVIALVFAFGIGALITRPLRGLNALTRRLAAGDVAPPPAVARGARETREMQAALAQLSASLRSRRDGRRAAVAQVSHESRNTLGSILGRIEALQDGTLTDGPSTLKIVEQEARRLLRQVEDLHRLVDDESDRAVRRASVELDGIVRASVLRHADGARARGIDLRYASTGPVIVESDPDRVSQLVESLMFTGLGSADAGGWVAVAVRRGPGEARLEVTYSGIETADQDPDDGFDPFWGGADGLTRAPDRLGAGVPVVREIVNALGGTVEVTGRVGGGSCLRVGLPAATHSRFGRASRVPDALRRPDAQQHTPDDASAWHRAEVG